jgi:hypothetical protein
MTTPKEPEIRGIDYGRDVGAPRSRLKTGLTVYRKLFYLFCFLICVSCVFLFQERPRNPNIALSTTEFIANIEEEKLLSITEISYPLLIESPTNAAKVGPNPVVVEKGRVG